MIHQIKNVTVWWRYVLFVLYLYYCEEVENIKEDQESLKRKNLVDEMVKTDSSVDKIGDI